MGTSPRNRLPYPDERSAPEPGRPRPRRRPGHDPALAAPGPRRHRPALASVALGGIAWFVASLAALHRPRPDVPPLVQGISRDANGPWSIRVPGVGAPSRPCLDIACVASGWET